jgi:hypothetical protein
MAVGKQEHLITEFMKDSMINQNLQIQSYLKRVVNDISQKLNDSIISLKLAEHQVFNTRYNLQSMVDTFLCFEDTIDYDEKTFDPEDMASFLE